MEVMVIFGLANALFAAVLALVAIVITHIWRNPFVARILWLAVLVKLITPPVFVVPLPWLGPGESAAESPVTPAVQHAHGVARRTSQSLDGLSDVASASENTLVLDKATASNDSALLDTHVIPAAPPWSPMHPTRMAAFVWLLGSLCVAGMVFFRIWRFHQAAKRTRPAPKSLNDTAATVAAKIGLRRIPQLRLVGGRVPPLVWSMGTKTTILLPSILVSQLKGEHVKAVLAHELVHVQRRDDWIRWLELLIVTLYWWNPIAWLARRKLHEAEERCCDAEVLRQFPGIARHYAGALLETLDFLAGAQAAPYLATGFFPRHSMKRRFEMILNDRPVNPLSLPIRGVLFAVALMAVLTVPLPTSSAEAKKEKESPVPTDDTVTCTITLADGRSIEGTIVLLSDERIIIQPGHASPELPLPDGDRGAESRQLQELWSISLGECVNIALQHNRQLEIMIVHSKGSDNRLVTSADAKLNRHQLKQFVEATIADVEQSYWQLWLAHRDLAAAGAASHRALAIWKKLHGQKLTGAAKVSADDEVEARSQYFVFRRQRDESMQKLNRAEATLRNLLGLASEDGHLMRPSDELVREERHFDWDDIKQEALSTRPELIKQRKEVRERQQSTKTAEPDQLPHQRLAVSREKMILKDLKLEVSLQLQDALRRLELSYALAQTNANDLIAAAKECDAVEQAYDAGRVSPNILLDTEQRRAEAQRASNRAWVDYMLALSDLHRSKGSVLEQHGFRLVEAP